MWVYGPEPGLVSGFSGSTVPGAKLVGYPIISVMTLSRSRFKPAGLIMRAFCVYEPKTLTGASCEACGVIHQRYGNGAKADCHGGVVVASSFHTQPNAAAISYSTWGFHYHPSRPDFDDLCVFHQNPYRPPMRFNLQLRSLAKAPRLS